LNVCGVFLSLFAYQFFSTHFLSCEIVSSFCLDVQGSVQCLIDLLSLQCRVSEQVEEDNVLIGDSAPMVNLTDEANRPSAAAVSGAGDEGEMSSHSDTTSSHHTGLSTSVQTSVTLRSYGI